MLTQCLFRFLLGGVLMVVVYVAAQKAGDFAGLLSALPIFSGAILLSNMTQGKGSVELIAQTSGAVEGMVCGFAFYLVANWALRCQCSESTVFALACAACVATFGVVKCVRGLVV